MKKMLLLVLVLSTGLLASESKKGVEALSAEVRGLLSQEMLHIEKGMQGIFSHMVKGEYEEIAVIATEIQNSFIFKKSLTDMQRAELKEKIPKAFITLDRSFHQTAGKLAEAAEFGDREGVQSSFKLMTGKCIECHSTYAKHRFETFDNEE